MNKRHFTVVEKGDKEHGLYVSSTPSSAAKKAVSKLCASNKNKKVEFYLREITQGSKKKTYGPYEGEMKKLKAPIELKRRVIKYETNVHLKNVKKSMKGGESEALKAILEIAKQKFFEENDIKNITNKPKILEKMQSLPNHSIVSHTSIETNWKDGAKVIQEIQDDKGKLIAKLYQTTIRLKKSATNKTIREILNGLRDDTIQIKFTWSPDFNLVFVNFYSTISDRLAIEYVNYVFEPCKEGAPPYSYYNYEYHKPSGIPPYQIISREFTNQIYEWLGRGNRETFIRNFKALTDENELPLRFIYD